MKSKTIVDSSTGHYDRLIEAINFNCKPLTLFGGVGGLTEMLKDSMKVVEDNPERYDERSSDILLLSNIASLGMCFPTARVAYDDKLYSLTPSLLIGGPSASNKRLASYGSLMLTHINEYTVEDFKARHREWEKKNFIFEQSKKQAGKKSKDGSVREVDYSLDPGPEPIFSTLLLPSNISKSYIYDLLKGNEQYGCLLFTTELDSFSVANSADFGQMDDLLNKALVNEPVDKGFRVDGKVTRVDYPILAFLGTGTIDQLHRFITSYETGNGSRFPVYLTSGSDNFVSQKPNATKMDYVAYYKELGRKVFEMWDTLRKNRFLVVFTDEQWERHFETWKDEFEEVKLSQRMMLSVATRYGFHHMRFAAVLAMLRYWQEFKDDASSHKELLSETPGQIEVLCSDTDYDIAEQIALTLFDHSMLFASTKVPNYDLNSKQMEQWRWQYFVLKVMPEQFSVQEFAEKAAEMYNKSAKTCYGVLNKMSKGRGKILKKLKDIKVGNRCVYKKVNVQE